MTKYSKIAKSTFAIIVMSLILCAVLAFGGTYAYFNAYTKSNTANVTVGTLMLGGDAVNGTIAITDVAKIVPNQTISLTSVDSAKLTGTTVAALRVKITVSSITAGDMATGTPDASKLTVAITNAAEYEWATDGLTEATSDGYYYLNKVVVGTDDGTALSTYGTFSVKLDSTAGNEWQGATCTFTIQVEAAQAEFDAEGANGEAMVAGDTITVENAKKLAWPTVA